MASGRTCRKVDRRGKLDESFDVEVAGDEMRVRFRGRVRTLTGADADAVRAAIDDPERLQLVVARALR